MPSNDVEAPNQHTAILPRSIPHPREGLKKPHNKLGILLYFLFGGVYALDSSTYDPIEIILNTDDEEEMDRLTERWKETRVNELNFIGIVAALLAGVLTSTGSWPNILPNGQTSPWPVRTSWYCGIILSIFSILTAAGQTVRLHRLSSHRDNWKNIRILLAKSNGRLKRSKETGRLIPNAWQVFAWQLPTMFLTTAALCMIVGMFLHVWSASAHLGGYGTWDDNSKVAVTFTVVGSVSIILFFFGLAALYTPDDDDDDN